MKATTRERFRQVLAGDRCVFPASVWDPISARIAADLGFESAMFAGSTASLTVLGAPDLIVLTLTEFAEQARRICRASSIPLLVDADHGYGNALNVRRTVEELENAGVAALTIEDTDLPRRFGEEKPALVTIDEAVGKLEAGIDARQDPGLAIVARTSVNLASGLDEVAARCKAYEKTGADALFLVGLRSRQELEAIARSVRGPLIVATLTKEMHDREHLSGNKVRVALQGHLPIMASIRATHESLRVLRQGAMPDTLESTVATPEQMKAVTRQSDYTSWQERFLIARKDDTKPVG